MNRQWTEMDLLIRDEAYKIGWNEAIEAAADIVDQADYSGPYQVIGAAKEIRKLKK